MRANARAGSNAADVSRAISGLKSILLASAGLLMMAQPALAAESASPGTVGEVIVTASRITNNGFQQPTPVTVVGQEQIKQEMPPTIATLLMELPSFGAANSSRLPGAGVAGGGVEAVNLRGLGPSRTLVLLDNRRVVPSSPGGAVDTLTMPSSLFSRVEVVTGGASAAWGADAVAGVVNFVLNHNYEGVGLNLQAGISERGDDKSISGDLTFGRKFMDGRIRWIGNVRYSDSPDVIKNQNRTWWRNRAAVTNPAFTSTNGQPKLITIDWAGQALVAPGGVITAGPLRGIQFVGPTGTPAPYNFGNPSGQVQWGGDVDLSISKTYNLSSPLRYGNAFTHVDFDVTDDITAYAELGIDYSRYADTGYFFFEKVGNQTIQADNAFLDPSIKQRMATLGLSSFTMGLTFIAGDPPHSINDRQVWRGVIGADGHWRGWNWHTYYQHGETNGETHTYNNPMPARFTLAVDAVRDPATGSIVCRSTLTNPTNGCIPLNIFGNESSSALARQYVQGTIPFQNTHVQLDVVSADASGKIYTLPAGDVTFAFGADWYREEADQNNDPLSTARQFATGNFQPFSGSRTVKEAFAETEVPILKDLPLIKSLELNAAGRITNYSTSGSVETWKFGASYQVTDDLRFRVTRSRDIRAPTLNDLYSKGNSGTQNVFDPVLNKTAQVFFISRGNPDLKPEDADTLTAGIIYQPSYISGLQLSLDYYHINIQGAITVVGSADTVARCFNGEPALCAFIKRDPVTNAIIEVDSAPQNIDRQLTTGYDFEADYRHQIWHGDLTVRALASYVPEFTQISNGVTRKRAGYLGTLGLDPYLRGNVTVNYTEGPMTYILRSRMVGPTKLNKYWKSGVDIDQNDLPSYAIFGLTLIYRTKVLGADSEITFDVENLFDRDPVQVPVLPDSGIYSFPGLAGRYDLYDPFGREFRIGYRAKW